MIATSEKIETIVNEFRRTGNGFGAYGLCRINQHRTYIVECDGRKFWVNIADSLCTVQASNSTFIGYGKTIAEAAHMSCNEDSRAILAAYNRAFLAA